MSLDEHDQRALELAARSLADGGVVAFPTETVYGLGASVRRPDAVARIFEIKGRPATRPLTVHVAGDEAIDVWAASAPSWVRPLVATLWPGPLTVILPKAASIADVVTGGGPTVGLRAPAHPIALALIERLSELEGGPAGIAAPSANRFGGTPPTSAADVIEGIGDAVEHVLDGGRCSLGIESTVLDATGTQPRILRPGAVSRERLVELTGLAVIGGTAREGVGAEIDRGPRIVALAAGSAAALRAAAGSAVICRCRPPNSVGDEVEWVELGDDDAEFARELYPALARLERAGRDPIYIELAGDDGELGAAINARILRRART